MKRQRGRWVVLKEARPTDPDMKWVVVLWGGSGSHPNDCAEYATWREAYDAACRAWWTTAPDLHLTQRTEGWR